ncbi:glycoside-pentoside-hexuronide (GPH):cation symporter [Scrofimicrobium sp. R131]|uniref:Glycoside-pentoside-hexuronide (GPH):cation symporter n=1 Tax=Scrofimicrobium appendicitidis TaxID=3079930 RepID=A0AAU7V783_9ACTO
MARQITDVRPFGWRDKIGYMFGDFGNDFSFILQMMFFMVFYTDVMGISAAHVGTLFLVARIVDAFTDVGMGRLVDLLPPSKNGRFRPWILRIAIPVALASTAMYMPFVVDASYGVRLTYMVITYVIWGSVFYTMINIPYGSMAAVVSDKPEHRASLSVFRSVGAQLAFLIISAILPRVVNVDNQLDGGRMAIAAAVCSILAVLCYVACYSLVRERIILAPKSKEDQVSFGQMLGTLGRNRPLLALVGGALLFLIGSQVAGTTTAYLWKDYFGAFEMMSWAQIVSIAPVFLISVIATRISMKYGKKELLATALTFSALLCIVAYFLHITSPMVFIIIFFFISIGVGFYNIIVWAIITDVLDYQEVVTGERDDGTIYAIYSWSRKLGQAVAGYVVGWAVSLVGYSAELAKAGEPQADSTLQGIYLLFLLVPGVLYLLTALVMGFAYPLSKKKVMENFHTLQERHAVGDAGSAATSGAHGA